MKILYHHRTASKDGQAVHIEEMIDALRALGHEVRVVAPGGARPTDGGSGRMGEDMGWVHRLKSLLPKAAYELMELAYSLLAYRRLMAAARGWSPDLIYERYNLYLLTGLMASRRLRVPLLLEVNAPLVFERLHHSGGLGLPWMASWAEGVAWRGAHKVLPVTGVLAGHIRARGVPDERIRVIPNGINEAHFAQAPNNAQAKQRLNLDQRLVFGFTGFVREWHGVDRIVDWMASPGAPGNAHLLIVGDGPIRAALEQQARRLGLDGRVTFTGVIDRHAVPEHVAAFDVALQPAVVPYASPLKLMEYLVMGKAIVAPREPNLLEVLSDGHNSLMFDAKDPKGLEEALSRVSADGELRQRLGLEARATIERLDLTWLGNARKVVALAQECSGR